MKRFLLILLIPIAILTVLSWTTDSPSKSINAKTIAVYNIDSILIKMPGYDSLVTVFTRYMNEYQKDDSLMTLEYHKKLAELNRDSSKFSPLIIELKKRELEELHNRIHEYRREVFNELEVRKKVLLEPLKEKIKTVATESGKTGGYLAVIFTEGYKIPFSFDFTFDSPPPYLPVLVNQIQSNALTYLDPKLKTISITKEITQKLGGTP